MMTARLMKLLKNPCQSHTLHTYLHLSLISWISILRLDSLVWNGIPKSFTRTHSNDCSQYRSGTTQKLFFKDSNQNSCQFASRKLKPTVLQTTRLPSANKHNSKQNQIPTGTEAHTFRQPQAILYLLGMTKKQKPATIGREALLTLTSNSNVKTNPLLCRQRVYDTKKRGKKGRNGRKMKRTSLLSKKEEEKKKKEHPSENT